jgi:hypothetical protein
MEARDLGDTITLYLPQAGGGREPYAVFQDRERVGGFSSQGEALQFAMALAETIRQSRRVPIRVRSEDEAGQWKTVDMPAVIDRATSPGR